MEMEHMCSMIKCQADILILCFKTLVSGEILMPKLLFVIVDQKQYQYATNISIIYLT